MPNMPDAKAVDLLNPARQFVNRLPDMSGIVERLVRNFRTQLFQDFRLNAQSVEGEFDIITHDEYLTPRAGYQLFGILNIQPIRGLSLITIEGTLLAALVDELFGASAPASTALARPQISNMEARIGRRLIDMLGKALQAAFQQYFTIQVELVRTEGYAALATVGDAADPYCSMRARVALPTGEGAISLALPYRGLEPHREILGSPAGGQAEMEARSYWADRITEAIESVPVEVGFEIGIIALSARSLSTLGVGDVLPLTFHRNARAMIGGAPVATVRYGAVGQSYGVCFSHDQQDP